jgi:hypothetical protein
MSFKSQGREWSPFFVATAIALAGLASGSLALADDRDEDRRNDFRIRTLSTKPELVSGGDVLVRIDVPRKVSLQSVRVELNGRNISGAFRADAAARTLTGLVTGLKLGPNTLEASVSGKGHGASERLTLTNHPISGPIFSGPHQTPFICETEVFGLGPALDEDCSAPTKVRYLYFTTANAFRTYDPAGPRPADLARTTTIEGNTVDFIVRVETGTINRAVYQIALIHQPRTPLPAPGARTAGWNGRLVYTFGGGLRASYHQGRWITGGSSGVPGAGVEMANIGGVGKVLGEGYALASSTFNVNNISGNDVISAETAMMVKERFIDQFGEPRYTMGFGASGGAMQQHLIAHNYPGILDGIQPGLSFPDSWTFLVTYTDCALLDDAFNRSSTPWTLEQKASVAGHRNYAHCTSNFPNWRTRIHPTNGCDPAIPPAIIFHPVSNPMGTRCTFQDNQKNIFGTDPATGYALRPLDNVGVQFGLHAFNSGAITFEQFVELNRRIGGFDINGEIVAARQVADAAALPIAYRTGRVNSGAGLDTIPILDSRQYLDERGDVHDASRSFIMRARLIAANGHADNQVIWTEAPTTSALNYKSLRVMDNWLANIANDRSDRSAAEKVVRNKPAEAVDACFTASGAMVTDPAACSALYPRQRNSRLAAGEPMTQSILKCHLKPISHADYSRPLAGAQLQALQGAFPQGVCDYSKDGVGQREARTWLAYPRPDGVPLFGNDDGRDRD